MIINNKIDRLLTGPKIFVALIFLLTGVAIAFIGNITIGAGIVILAVFFMTAYSGVEVDTTNHRIKQYNSFFGCIKTGKWQNIDAFIGLTLVPMRHVNTIASRANLTNSTVEKDFRIFLVNKAKRPAFAIKVCKNKEMAQNSIDEFAVWLKLPVFSIK